MRQEKIMKVIVNHSLDPRIKLEPNLGNDRSWVWSAFDFASGDLLETYFAIRLLILILQMILKRSLKRIKKKWINF